VLLSISVFLMSIVFFFKRCYSYQTRFLVSMSCHFLLRVLMVGGNLCRMKELASERDTIRGYKFVPFYTIYILYGRMGSIIVARARNCEN